MTIINPRDGRLIIVRKTAAQIVNNSNVLQDDNDLKVHLHANSQHEGTLTIWGISAVLADWNFAFTGPAGFDGLAFILSGFEQKNLPFSGSMCSARGSDELIMIHFIVVNGGTPGDFKFRWAQQTPNVSDSTIYEGSNIVARRLN